MNTSEPPIILAQVATGTSATAPGTVAPLGTSIWTSPLFHNVLLMAAIALVIVVAMIVVRRSITRRITNPEQRRRFRKLNSLVGFTLLTLSAAFVFSNSLASLTVSLGVAGAAVAFALQQVLASAVAWIQISAGRVYGVGDRVKMGGVIGDVIHINVFLTTLMEVGGDWIQADQYSGRVVRIPNSAIYKDPIFNYSADFEYVWDELKVPIRYGSDRVKAVALLQEAIDPLAESATSAMREHWQKLKDDYAIEDAKLEPSVFLLSNDNWLEYSIRYLVHYKSRRTTKSELCERVVGLIESSEGAVSIASGTYDIVGVPEITVRLSDLSSQKLA